MKSAANPQYMPKGGSHPALQPNATNRKNTITTHDDLPAADRRELLYTIAEVVQATKARAETAPPLEREALLAVVVLMRRRADQLRGAGRRAATRRAS